MVQIADHLGVADLQAGWRESKDVTLTRHYQVIWLLDGEARPWPQWGRASPPNAPAAATCAGGDARGAGGVQNVWPAPSA